MRFMMMVNAELEESFKAGRTGQDNNKENK